MSPAMSSRLWAGKAPRTIGAAALVYAVGALIWQRPDYLLPSAGLFPGAAGTAAFAANPVTKLQMTEVVALEAGYTIVENLYWQNWTFHFVTDQPQRLPDLEYVSTDGLVPAARMLGPLGPNVIVSVRDPVVVINSREAVPKPHISMTPAEALETYGSVEELAGNTLMCVDSNFINHYYHWMGELFLGGWRLWVSHYTRRGEAVPDFDRIAFPRASDLEETDDPEHAQFWEDKAGANKWFMQALFPGATHESYATWAARAAAGTRVRLPRVLLIDRKAGHYGAGMGGKPFADVFRVPVPTDYMLPLRARALAGHAALDGLRATERRPDARPRLPKVGYLSRQDTARALAPAVNDALIAELEALADDGIVEFELLQFDKTVPFVNQVATIAQLDFFVGVHGNGLTHAMWMTPGGNRAVIEMQSKDCNYNDYAALALATGTHHFNVNGDQFCRPNDCLPRGCNGEFKSSHHPNIVIEPKLVSGIIRDSIAAWR